LKNDDEESNDVKKHVVMLYGKQGKTGRILWTNPEPSKRDFGEFSARAAEHRRRLIREHVNYAPLK
jgi:hypothetical protein